MTRADYHRLASFQQKIESLSWTPYFEQCLQKLEESKEFSTDEFFVHQIRLQRIVEKATIAYVQIRDVKHDNSATVIALYIRTLKAQFAELGRNIPSDLANNSKSGVRTYH